LRRRGYLELVKNWVGAFPDGRLQIDHVEQRGDNLRSGPHHGTGTHRAISTWAGTAC
jgi:hypothetical protein